MNSKFSLLATLVLLSGLFFAGCKKEKTGTSDSDAEYYFIAKLDGQSLVFEATSTNDIGLNIVNAGSVGSTDCTFSYGCSIGSVLAADAPMAVISFPDIFVGDCALEEASFSGLFKTGTYNYGNTTGKVMLSYWDGAAYWTSDPAVQTNAKFTVTASERIESVFGVTQKVSGTANCVLANGSGEKKALENVKFTMSFSAD